MPGGARHPSLIVFVIAIVGASSGDHLAALVGVSNGEKRRCVSRQCNNPKTATLFVVATNTLPSATVGTMNLLPVPK